MKTLFTIFIIAFLQINCPMAQVNSTDGFSQVDELSILDFKQDSRSRAYIIKTDIYIYQDLDEIDYQLTLSFDQEESTQDLPNKDDVLPLYLGSHEFTYNLENDGRLVINLFNPNGGTPWSTLDMHSLTVSFSVENEHFQSEPEIITQSNDTTTIFIR